MAGELVFTVEPGTARRAHAISLADAGLRERSDLQEWVRENPEILGDGVRIVTFEFDAWWSRRGREADRLDLLGLDEDGYLVLAELKRGPAPDTVEMQAIKYAAFASRFTVETLAERHAEYLSKMRGERVSDDEARERLEEHVGEELDPALLRRPRIALLAESFPPQVTASAVWLTEMGLDISLVEFKAYRTEHDLVLVTSRIWPLAEVEDFTVAPRELERREATELVRTRRQARTVAILVEEEAIEEGTLLELDIAAAPAGSRDQVAAWVADDPQRAQATWRNNRSTPLIWKVDGGPWSASGLAKEIVERATDQRPNSAGPWWWKTADGETLSALANELRGRRRGLRDWSDLHTLLDRVGPGEWTTYGDLAEAIDSSARAVGGHITACDDCSSAHRVLTTDGEVAGGFHWSDPADTRDPADLLREEGVAFSDGRADPAHRLDAHVLRERSG